MNRDNSDTGRWLLPQGIDEALPEQAMRLESLRRQLLDLYSSWGYQLVMPPFIEYIESLLTGTGHDLDLQTFKLIDQLTGRTLGVRADMTPQIARIDSHQLACEEPARLCYAGTVLHTRPDAFGGSRSPLQLGAELYGHSGIESEVEILCLVANTMSVAGVEDVYIDIGNVDIFRALARQMGLDIDQQAVLFEMLQRKAIPEIATYLDGLDVEIKHTDMMAALAELNGGADTLQRARVKLKAANAGVHEALDYLEQVADLTSQRADNITLLFDLAELRGFHYQTGVVFAAYVPGRGQEIARGGRYDDIGKDFGRARPATGFSTDLKTLDSLSVRRDVSEPGKVFAPAIKENGQENGQENGLGEKISSLRATGVCVIEELPGQQGDAKAMGCAQLLSYKKGKWVVIDVN